MSTHNILEPILEEILHVINPVRKDWETRKQIIDELRDVVCSIESLKGATVEPFGSFLSQLFTRWGDLDISIELSNGSHISTAARKHKQTLLADVLKALRKTGGFRRLQFVINARVPILKLESKYENISCDISINNLSGQMKSKFLLWISLIDSRFRDMVLLVKEWAKANYINDPKFGTFNSYSLSLLVIFHFQTCTPAILPPLKDIYSGNIADELMGIRADVERRIEEVSVSNIAMFRKERRVNHSSLSKLFTSFLSKYEGKKPRHLYIHWKMGRQQQQQQPGAIPPREQGPGGQLYAALPLCKQRDCTGKWEDISTNTRWLPKTYAIFIEDPFEQPENTARAVTSFQLTRISEAFSNTFHWLNTPNQTRNTLIPSLVRHETSQFVTANGGARANSRTNHNAPRGNQSSPQYQHQFHRARQVNHANNATAHKPNRASQGRRDGDGQPVQLVKPQSPGQAKNVNSQRPQSPGQAKNVNSQRPVKPSQVWRAKQSTG